MQRIGSGSNFVRYALGELAVVALRDGYVDMPVERIQPPDGAVPTRELVANTPLYDGKLRLSVNAFAIIADNHTLLIDTGASDAWDPTMGGLGEALGEAGIDRADIDLVALTHTHRDHVSGLVTPDGKVAFPNAERVLVPRAELDAVRNSRFAAVQDRIVAFDPGEKISDAVTAVAAPGHSPAHTAFEVRSRAGTLLIWGDTVHVPSVQFAEPAIAWGLDGDQGGARASRAALFERAVQPGTFVAGTHLDFPGVGRVQGSEKPFVFRGL